MGPQTESKTFNGASVRYFMTYNGCAMLNASDVENAATGKADSDGGDYVDIVKAISLAGENVDLAMWLNESFPATVPMEGLEVVARMRD